MESGGGSSTSGTRKATPPSHHHCKKAWEVTERRSIQSCPRTNLTRAKIKYIKDNAIGGEVLRLREQNKKMVRAQCKEQLAPVKKGGRIDDWGKDWKNPRLRH